MITIGFSTRRENNDFKDHIRNTVGVKGVEVIEVINNGEKSLTTVYNEILNKSAFDIVVLCHDDIFFNTKNWGFKILKHFEKSDYGILGVAGTKYIDKNCVWWETSGEMMGQVYHKQGEKVWLSEYNKEFGNRIMDAVLVDGLFMGINKKRLRNDYNEDITGFHFYDVDFCLSNYLGGTKIGVISNVRLTHLSIGMVNVKWDENRKYISKKYDHKLPILVPTIYEAKNNTKKPLVSVVMPIFNYGKMFHKAIESVFESDYPNIELIVVNDGSTNEYVLNKIKSLGLSNNVKIINQENKGQSAARNVGIRESNGEYILPLDSDDQILPEYISTCVSIISRDKKLSPVYCDTIHIGEISGVEVRPEWSLDRLKQGPFIVNCSMFSKQSFLDVNGFDEDLKGWEDYDFWLRLAINGYVGKRIKKPLFIYFHHEKDGTISTEANKNQFELYNAIMEKNFGS